MVCLSDRLLAGKVSSKWQWIWLSTINMQYVKYRKLNCNFTPRYIYKLWLAGGVILLSL